MREARAKFDQIDKPAVGYRAIGEQIAKSGFGGFHSELPHHAPRIGRVKYAHGPPGAAHAIDSGGHIVNKLAVRGDQRMGVKRQAAKQVQQSGGDFHGIDLPGDGGDPQDRLRVAVFGINKPIAVKGRGDAPDGGFRHLPVILARHCAVEPGADACKPIVAGVRALRGIKTLHIQISPIRTQNRGPCYVLCGKRRLGNIEADRRRQRCAPCGIIVKRDDVFGLPAS